jgi:L-ascorbate metabolism protein UlaG (beta-lactamase superfamily)
MKLFRKIMMITLFVVVALVVVVFLFMQQPSFGKLPLGERLTRIERSPQYKKDHFENILPTAMMADDVSYPDMLRKFFFATDPLREPDHVLPAVKTDLRALGEQEPVIVWFGHSSYFLRIDGKNILVDPVFSKRASPVQYAGSEQFPGTEIYSADDFPDIDLMIITHDHYDHLDYGTIKKMHSRTKAIYTSLGVGSHLAYWGVPESKIHELDWWEQATALPGIELTATPARHFSGRGFIRNKTLWSSFVLKTSTHKIFLGGDSGYDASFKNIGDKFGPFDLALLESGQYDKQWPFIHMMPEETVLAAKDLQAKVLMPVHWGKFRLALHPWNESIQRVTAKAAADGLPITTPRIGEPIAVGGPYPQAKWW